jgi:protein TonB
MDLSTWTTQQRDPARAKRLLIGYVVGIATIIGFLLFATLTATGVIAAPQDEIRDVKLAKATPPPEPKPVIKAAAPKPKPRRGGRRGLSVPMAIPDSKPMEIDPGINPYGDEGSPDLWVSGEGGGDGLKKKEVKKANPKPRRIFKPRPPPTPTRVVERVLPPTCTIPTPGYPSDARALGVQGTVVIRYTVSATGRITNIRVLRGPRELRAAGLSALRNATCQPATLDGDPVAVFRIARFPFRLRT